MPKNGKQNKTKIKFTSFLFTSRNKFLNKKRGREAQSLLRKNNVLVAFYLNPHLNAPFPLGCQGFCQSSLAIIRKARMR